MKRGGWELRRALRYGSKLIGWSSSLKEAKRFAKKEIEAHGNVGRIEMIDRDTRTLYYDVHEEMA